LSAALLGAAGLACKPASAESSGEKAEFGRLSVDEVEKGIADKSLHIFDNNSEKRFAEGHVPTAKWVNYHDLKASDLPSDKTAKLVFYCSNSF
jgi:hypothetical protein